MPFLAGSTLRVLLIVHRRQDDRTTHKGRCEGADWVSHRTLVQSLASCEDASSRAIGSLVSTGFIEIVDEAGKVLATSRARKTAFQGRYYRTGPVSLKDGALPLSRSLKEVATQER
jgi:hypothetical protein